MMKLASTVLLVLSVGAALCRAQITAGELATLTASSLLNVSMVDGNYQFTSTGLPDHETQKTNPNDPTDQDHRFNIPQNPSPATTPGCLSLGAIGLFINGVPAYNPYTGDGYNAVEGENREIFDDCLGHPSPDGSYHYHQLPICLWRRENEQIMGVAFDGYLIYGPLDKNGNNVTNSQLDVCHGMTVDGVYRYVINYEFPYIIGCYHGDVLENDDPLMGGDGGVMGPPPAGGQGPPPPGQGPPQGGQGPPQGGQVPPQGGMGGGRVDICVYANVSDASDLFTAIRNGGNGGDVDDGGDDDGDDGEDGGDSEDGDTGGDDDEEQPPPIDGTNGASAVQAMTGAVAAALLTICLHL